jgi:hypothetical protein
MRTPSKRWLESNRGPFKIDNLLKQINSNKHSKAVREVLELIAEINNRGMSSDRFRVANSEKNRLHDRIVEDEINLRFRRFKFVPLVMVIEGEWSGGIDLVPSLRSVPRERWGFIRAEYDLIIGLRDAAQRAILNRLARCPGCSKWIFRRVAAQRFCSKQCRERVFKSSDNWRAHRRKYMRDYYRLKNSGVVK